jgi:hypothetical protein
MKNLPIHIKIILGLVILFFAISAITKTVGPGIDLFNNTSKIALDYNAKVQEQVSNYDGYYLAFKDKQENANINKETFVAVTNIIMTHRADGAALSWKWVQENQQIPYDEFTSFYKELSAYISSRYENNMQIERDKQKIVKDHNVLLTLFPGNMYNKVLHIKPLVYKAGYISDSTAQRFK